MCVVGIMVFQSVYNHTRIRTAVPLSTETSANNLITYFPLKTDLEKHLFKKQREKEEEEPACFSLVKYVDNGDKVSDMSYKYADPFGAIWTGLEGARKSTDSDYRLDPHLNLLPRGRQSG